ncbi:tryptophanyl-tRNA synthetase [Persephonella hydrogeniphila]|uniref:Tryptophan--tRNA ligase n=1 Tax=Persephonella hydrogeniphila TaxID=198703 RepID=A0A285NEB1_9AQUI|nr:tryptophan--tRNA ligase [Persephonella hydrogeniphila]SNZ07844.1 tryptophanyl-tRNA synthetase [Persephonella hydrogeniphila]
MKKVLSGMRPTGRLHLGHYLGVIKNWLELQEKYDCKFFIADWHALTNKYKDTSELKENIRQMIIDWLSCGINPEKATLFIQSGVKEHAELALLFSMITPKSWLELNPSYKDLKFNLYYQYLRDFLAGKQIKIIQTPPSESFDEALKKATGKQKNKIFEEYLREAFHRAFYNQKGIDFKGLKEMLIKFGIQKKIVEEVVRNLEEGDVGKDIDTLGFLAYPVLQAADILIYKADAVPVGEDQLPHIELTREIARRFNNLYKEIFPEPEAMLTEASKLPGIDGRKMSKSYNNAIYLSDSKEEVDKKVLQMKTDPQRVRKTDPGNPEVCIVFDYHRIFTDKETVEDIDKKCRKAEIGCVECKKILSKNLNRFLDPIRERRKEIEKDLPKYEKMFFEGTEKARKEASETMREVRKAMKLWEF